LTIHGERVIWFERDENGYDRLNLIIRDYLGNIILKMENNDWIIYTKDVFDVECPAQGKSLKIISKDKFTNFELRFDELELEAFRDLLSSMGYEEDGIRWLISSMQKDNPDRIPLWTLKGKITYIDMDINIKEDGWEIDIDGAMQDGILKRIVVVSCSEFLRIGNDQFDTSKRNPASQIRQLMKRKQIVSYKRNEIKFQLNEIDAMISDLEKCTDANLIYRNTGKVLFISDKDRLIYEYKNRKKSMELQRKAITQQEMRTNVRLRRAQKAIIINANDTKSQ